MKGNGKGGERIIDGERVHNLIKTTHRHQMAIRSIQSIQSIQKVQKFQKASRGTRLRKNNQNRIVEIGS